MYQEMNDPELLEAWKAGDQRAGIALVTRHHAIVTRFFSNKPGTDCDELVQETFEGLLETDSHLRSGPWHFRTMLFATARKKLLCALWVPPGTGDQFEPGEMAIGELASASSQLPEARDERTLLLIALSRLPLDTQIALELHRWERMTVEEIAEVLDRSVGVVKCQMIRGCERLDGELRSLAEQKDLLLPTVDSLSEWAVRLRAELET